MGAKLKGSEGPGRTGVDDGPGEGGVGLGLLDQVHLGLALPQQDVTARAVFLLACRNQHGQRGE